MSEVFQGEAGSDLAEAALVLPLMFTILLGIFWFGQAFSIYGTITHAAREGARAAVAPACATCGGINNPSQNAYDAVSSAILAAKLDPSKLQKPAPPPGLCICGSSSTSCTGGGAVQCDNGQTNICVQGVDSKNKKKPPDQDNVQLASTRDGGAGVCGLSVSFVYPYTFWLPGTSLNKRQILLKAQAEMRVETQ